MSNYQPLTWDLLENNHFATLHMKEKLTTNCECEYDCGSDCFVESSAAVANLLDAWARGFNFESVKDIPKVRIDGKRMGWLASSGWIVIPGANVLHALQLDRGEYTLEFDLECDSLKVVRYSHDEPTGAFFDISIPYPD